MKKMVFILTGFFVIAFSANQAFSDMIQAMITDAGSSAIVVIDMRIIVVLQISLVPIMTPLALMSVLPEPR